VRNAHGCSPLSRGLRYNEKDIGPGAQTVRPGGARAGGTLLGGWSPPADFPSVHITCRTVDTGSPSAPRLSVACSNRVYDPTAQPAVENVSDQEPSALWVP